MSMRDLWGGLARAQGGYVPGMPEPAAPKSVPRWRCDVGDASVWGRVDSLQPVTFPCWAAGVAALEVHFGDAVAATFAPTDAGPAPEGLHLSLDAYEMLVAQHGHDLSDEVDDWWHREGQDAMAEALPGETPAPELRQWRGEVEVRLRMAESVGRSYGLSPKGHRGCDRQTVHRAALDAAGVRTGARAGRGTARAAGGGSGRASGEGRRRGRAGPPSEHRRSALGRVRGPARARWRHVGTRALGRLAADDALADRGRALPGAPRAARPPRARSMVCERCATPRGPRQVPVHAMPAREPDRAALEFLHAIRVEAACNFGAVRELVLTIPPRAHELAKQWAGTSLSPQPTLAWRTDWLCELFIRCAEFRMRVDVALIKVLLPALDEAWKKLPQNEPIKIPTHRALTHDLDGNLLQRPDEFKLVERYGEGYLPSPKHARDARREARRCSDERPLRRGRRVVRSAATGTRSEWHQTIEEANIEVTRETRQSNVMANSLSSYEPTPAHRALAAEGLTLLDQETLAAFATRVGWKMDAEDWPNFLDRKRGTSSRADADAGPAFREDAAAHGIRRTTSRRTHAASANRATTSPSPMPARRARTWSSARRTAGR